MYNWFTRNFDDELNAAFLQFKNEGITDLVVDLRYNPGGFVSSAIALSSMITGQFKGEIFSKQQWNSKWQEEIQNSDPGSLIDKFTDKLSNGNSINSLRLIKVHFIVSGKSASASELVISGLKPYVDVSLVGTRTVGKYVASTTLYDSDNFSKSRVNPNHTYAIQPLIYKSVNKLDESSKDGFEPQILLAEDIGNMGILGNKEEPLFNAAIANITGIMAKIADSKKVEYETIGGSDMKSRVKNNMFVDNDGDRALLKRTRTKEK
jgi:C-terminal processing protease CtpA/Prc